jgi:hypothetical protein
VHRTSQRSASDLVVIKTHSAVKGEIMKRTPLIISILLNVALIAGLFAFRSYFRRTTFQQAVVIVESETAQYENLLKVLLSDDPNRLDILEQRFRQGIENGSNFTESMKAVRW